MRDEGAVSIVWGIDRQKNPREIIRRDVRAGLVDNVDRNSEALCFLEPYLNEYAMLPKKARPRGSV
jgi:hypothetical protein